MSKKLIKVLNQAGYDFSPEQIDQLQQYCDQLYSWNKKINLTSIDRENFISHHILDSLSIIGELNGSNVLDMGTGGGLPGVPLAIVCADKSFTLLDARNKKIRFIEFVKGTLKLSNIHPIHQRVEDHHPQPLYDAVIARAFTSMEKIYQLAKPLVAAKGKIIAMKGRYPTEELKQLDHMQVKYEVKSVDVFELDAERHVVIIENDHN